MLGIFLYINFLFSSFSSNIHCYFNNIFHEFKVLKKVITEMFNVNFHNKFLKFWVVSFFKFSWYHNQKIQQTQHEFLYLKQNKTKKNMRLWLHRCVSPILLGRCSSGSDRILCKSTDGTSRHIRSIDCTLPWLVNLALLVCNVDQ